jgi:hypothetical protein
VIGMTAGRVGWSLWWRWVVWTLLGLVAGAVVLFATYLLGGWHRGEPIPDLALPLTALTVSTASGGLQSRLLRGHVRAPHRWFAIALVDGALTALILLVQKPAVPPTAPTYVLLGGAAFITALARWWFVLRPDVPRAAAWVPITLAATAAVWVLPSLSSMGLRDLGFAFGLLVPAAQATGLLYLLGSRAPPTPVNG